MNTEQKVLAFTFAGRERFASWLNAMAKDDVRFDPTALEALTKFEDAACVGESMTYELGSQFTLSGRPEIFSPAPGDVEWI